jgi:hypothetical protein
MLSSVESVKQLQDLTALETLELWSAETMAPEVLQQASGLTNITELRLGYFPKTPEQIEDHAGVWPVLPALKGLDMQWHVQDGVLPEGLISQLPQCSGLTRLSIAAGSDIDAIGGASEDFASAVSQLQQLQELRLAGAGFVFAESFVVDDEIVDDMQTVLRGLLGLQQLRSLALVNVDLSFDGNRSDFRDLQKLTQLTRLEIESPADSSTLECALEGALWHVQHLTELRVLRLAMPVWVGIMHALPYANKLRQLQQIAYVIDNFASARWLWDMYGAPNVCVMHIEADGCTTHVCGGEGAPRRHFPVPFPGNFEVAYVQHG